MFISPMLASPLPNDKAKKPFIFTPDTWAAEEKYDGIRIIAEVNDGQQPSLFVDKGIKTWSRYGIEHPLPSHLQEGLSRLPNGLYDGEILVPGKRSYGATEIANAKHLQYVIFDAINFEGIDMTELTYDQRRDVLAVLRSCYTSAVSLAPSTPVNTWSEVTALRDAVWSRDGEGLILKKREGLYVPGKRSKDFIKIKDKKTAALTVAAWQESTGMIDYRGKYAIVILKDDEGFTTSVKVRNNALCEALEAEARRTGQPPFIGRKLRIEYQERTPDGSYRHPRWDRWEDE